MRYKQIVSIFLIFFLALFLIPIKELDVLNLMPGELYDTRLNNYFLENIYSFFSKNSISLWHLSFFYPYPYVIGFSDNLFGAAPVYLFFRFLNLETDTAYQVWFLFGYAANYYSAYYALRRLGGSMPASIIGALIFAFALPTTAHAGHAQLHYRFGVPLAITFFIQFLSLKAWRLLLISGAWLTWQFYAGVYMGFFTLLLILAMTLAFVILHLIQRHSSTRELANDFVMSWRRQESLQKYIFLFGLSVLALLMGILFYPYLQVVQLYEAKRSWEETSLMLPRLQSYFMSDSSLLWSTRDNALFAGIPMRHEHQMFMGFVPLLLALNGLIFFKYVAKNHIIPLMVGTLAVTFAITLSVNGYSIWYLFHDLPLASAIRALTRLDQVYLFPIAYLAVVGIDQLKERSAWVLQIAVVIVILLFIFEATMTSMQTVSKESWRQRLSNLLAITPQKVPQNSILFFAQRMDDFDHNIRSEAHEVDAMWVSLLTNTKTMNGYSGSWPPGYYDPQYGNDCIVIPKRVASYLQFIRQPNNADLYHSLMSRIVPIGFKNCDLEWWKSLQSISSASRIYTSNELSKITLSLDAIKGDETNIVLPLIINNLGNQSFAADSAIGKPIRVSWRFIDDKGQPLSGWEARKDLPLDIPANGKLKISIPLNIREQDKTVAVQVSMVQDGAFWLHDIGVNPITTRFK